MLYRTSTAVLTASHSDAILATQTPEQVREDLRNISSTAAFQIDPVAVATGSDRLAHSGANGGRRPNVPAISV